MSKEIVVYWTGNCNYFGKTGYNWNILYPSPPSLYKDLSINLNKNNDTPSFYQCPAFKSVAQNSFVVKNPLSSHYKVIDESNLVSLRDSSMEASIIRKPTLENMKIIKYALSFLAFSEESLVMCVTPPYMHDAHHLNYGSVVPGKFNISKWFRSFNPEINLKNNVEELSIPENDPLYYVSFETEKKIKMVKFEMSEVLGDYANTCSKSCLWEPRTSMEKRYDRFISSKAHKTIIKEIKKNVID